MNTTDATGRTELATSAGRFSSQPAHGPAVSVWLLSLVLFREPLQRLASLSFQDDRSSHILLIPLISGFLIFLQRKRVFRAPRYCPSIGIPLLTIAVVLWGLTSRLSQLDSYYLSAVASVIVLVWIGGFILCYGPVALKAAAFPLLFLLLTIPIPVVLLESTVSFLQKGSAEVCSVLFRLVGVPFVRHGVQFSLPGIDIQVAEQCSGIHSALALIIVGLLLQHVFLAGAWKKAVFVLFILPIAIFKNAVRIVTIAWLGIHVNPAFFYGQLHHQGGLPFSVLAVVLLGLLLFALRRPIPSRYMRSASIAA